jgi:hypothetical protein
MLDTEIDAAILAIATEKMQESGLMECREMKRADKKKTISLWVQNRVYVKAGGNTLGIAPQIAIGHAELKFTWPGRDLKPVWQSPSQYWSAGGKRPPSAWGSIEHGEASNA